tara:strand:- start:3330 stop:3542 length:213 start_codon:yes stop_codon:yes gene_type:complete
MESSNEILLALGRLEGKVDSLVARQKVIDDELDKHESRLRSLEQGKSWMLGAAAAVGALVSYLFKGFSNG